MGEEDVLKWARKWIQWNDINGDKVTWGSHDRLDMILKYDTRWTLMGTGLRKTNLFSKLY